ncbi:MAG: outer membrane beta-barrel protein [Sphingomonadaceae bacterium]
MKNLSETRFILDLGGRLGLYFLYDRRAIGSLFTITVISALFSPFPAFAQLVGEPEMNDVAGNRPQPDYDPQGVDVSGVRIFPAIGITGNYDSNVLTRSQGGEADFSATVLPSVRIEKIRSNAVLRLNAQAGFRRYASLDRQNDNSWSVNFNTAFDLPSDLKLTTFNTWSRSSASRGTFENNLQVGDPLRVERLGSGLKLQRRFNRLGVSGGFSAEKSDFDDVTLDDGTTIDQDFRDGSRISGTLRADYAFSPRFSVVADGRFDRFDFSDPRPASNRDAKAWAATLGGRYEISRLFHVEAGAGYRQHNFDSPALKTISGLALNARARWYPSRLISVRFDLSQQTTTSVYDTVSAVTVTSAALSGDYEYRRNILLSASVTRSNESYGGTGGHSNLTTIGSSATWSANRWMRLTGRVSYETRSNSGTTVTPVFDAFRFMTTLTFSR